MARQAAFYLRAPSAYEREATAKFWKPGAPERYALLIRRLEAHEDMTPAALELLYRGLAAELGCKLVDVAQLTRIALTGRTASPPIFEVISILGKAETLARLRAAADACAEARAVRTLCSPATASRSPTRCAASRATRTSRCRSSVCARPSR